MSCDSVFGKFKLSIRHLKKISSRNHILTRAKNVTVSGKGNKVEYLNLIYTSQ